MSNPKHNTPSNRPAPQSEKVFKYLDANGMPRTWQELTEKTGVSSGEAYFEGRVWLALKKGEAFFQTGYRRALQRKKVIDFLNANGNRTLLEIVKATRVSDGIARCGKREWLAAKYGIISTHKSVEHVVGELKKAKQLQTQKKQSAEDCVLAIFSDCQQELRRLIETYGRPMLRLAVSEINGEKEEV